MGREGTDHERYLMSAATAALDPDEAIAAAMRDLYDQLREIVDRGPTDDPGLLDELGKLTGRVRSRITRARKRAAADTEPVAEKPTATAAPTTVPVATPAPAKPAVAPTATSDQTPRTVPATTVPASPRVTVPIVPSPTTQPTATTSTLRPRPTRLPLWIHALILFMVAGVAVALTATAWGSPTFRPQRPSSVWPATGGSSAATRA